MSVKNALDQLHMIWVLTPEAGVKKSSVHCAYYLRARLFDDCTNRMWRVSRCGTQKADLSNTLRERVRPFSIFSPGIDGGSVGRFICAAVDA